MLRIAQEVIKHWTNSSLRLLGYEIRKCHTPYRFLAASSSRTILDIGANAGQFAKAARRCCPAATIHAFEPVAAVFDELQSAFRADSRFKAYNMALGSEDGLHEMLVSAFSPSSSLLRMSTVHTSVFPHTAAISRQSTHVTTLDSWAAANVLEDPIFAKLDVQGYEDRVIAGGRRTLSRAKHVLVEISFVELYQDQLLCNEILGLFWELGFRLIDVFPDRVCPTSGCTLFGDALFERS